MIIDDDGQPIEEDREEEDDQIPSQSGKNDRIDFYNEEQKNWAGQGQEMEG